MADVNLSDSAREARCRELACLDWANTPSSVIKERFEGISYQTLSNWRDSDVYKEQSDELRKAWSEEMLRLPSTGELRKKISQGMSIAVNVLIECLTSSAAYKDKISAARLVSQIDGRFLRSGEDEEGRSRETDSLAAELLDHIKQQRAN
jgi:hypothetical protein